MAQEEKILEGHSDLEKGAYLGAIASLATADRQASPEELEHIAALCDSAQLSEPQKQAVLRAANELSGAELTRCLDILKNSDLKYSLITDMIAFAKSDSDYSESEQQSITKTAQYLGVSQQQFSLLDEFAQKATDAQTSPEVVSRPGFLSSIGLKDKLQGAGINPGSLLKGLVGIAGPMILTRMLMGGLNRSRSGGFFGRQGGFGSGGLGSIISMLNGGRGLGSTGGLLGRVLGGGF